MLKNKALSASAAEEVGWDITTAVFSGTPINFFNIRPQGSTFYALYVSGDGLNFYVSGTSGNVYQYTASTAWDLNTVTYTRSFSTAAQTTNLVGIAFKSDGTKMYVTAQSPVSVFEYTLSTAWNISTATYSTTISISAQGSTIYGLQFGNSGLAMYVVDDGSNQIDQYTLSTAWNVSTATYTRTLDITAQSSTPYDLDFSTDGTKLYIADRSSPGKVVQYTLSTAWNLSTATFTRTLNFSAVDVDAPGGVKFKPDGTAMYIRGQSSRNVKKYDLSTAWDISTATYNNPTTDWYSVSPQTITGNNTYGIAFKPDGSRFYVTGLAGGSGVVGEIDQYSTSTNWEINTASYVTTFNPTSQTFRPVDINFNSDGTKFYLLSTTSPGTIYQYSLSTAWDISTASYDSKSFDISVQTAGSYGLTLKTDGTKLYVTSFSLAKVFQYTLSTPWDISTASYDSVSLDVAAYGTGALGVKFKPDGRKIYIMGYTSTGTFILQYNLSAAWDISTATYYGQSLNFYKFDTGSFNFAFKLDGTQVYVAGASYRQIWAFDLQ
jgi:hypothetical protein